MESISIHSSSIIIPNRPTPNLILPLSESDQFRAWTHVPNIYVYKSLAVTTTVVESLKSSLSQILVPYYPLAGRLRLIAGGRLELYCCASGALFIEASSTTQLEDYGDFTPSDVVRQLAPEVDYNSPIEDVPMLLVQVTRFSCGKLVIGVNVSHTLMDGVSAITFINSWASIARGEKTADSILQPLHDRNVIQPQKPFRSPRFHHCEYDVPPVLIGYSDSKEEQKKEIISTLLKLTKEQVERLKERANSSSPTDQNDKTEVAANEVPLQPRPYSRYESIAGHIWVCACKARSIDDDKSKQPTVVQIVVNIRQKLRKPIPKNFSGNATLISITPPCEFRELMSQPLSYAAGRIREAAWKMTSEYATSAMDFLATREDICWTRTSSSSSCSIVRVKSTFWGNPNLCIGTWTSMPMYDADFGWGRPNYVGPTNLGYDEEGYIMPGPNNDDSLIVVIQLQKRHMEDFKKFFYELL